MVSIRPPSSPTRHSIRAGLSDLGALCRSSARAASSPMSFCWPTTATTAIRRRSRRAPTRSRRTPTSCSASSTRRLSAGTIIFYGDNGAANAAIKRDNPEMTDGQIAYSIAKMKERGIVDSGDALTLWRRRDDRRADEELFRQNGEGRRRSRRSALQARLYAAIRRRRGRTGAAPPNDARRGDAGAPRSFRCAASARLSPSGLDALARLISTCAPARS